MKVKASFNLDLCRNKWSKN